MANKIGRAQKIEKQNRKRPGVTNDASKSTLYTSISNDKFNENIDVESK